MKLNSKQLVKKQHCFHNGYMVGAGQSNIVIKNGKKFVIRKSGALAEI